MVNENKGYTDIQFKNDLRKELLMYQDYLQLLKKGDYETLEQKFNNEIDRINKGLQD